MNPDERLFNLAKAVSDGDEIDWSRAESEAADENERELLRHLRDIHDVAELHRTMRQASGPPERAKRVPPLDSWGPLEIREKVGEGAAAEVYRAWDPKLERDVALKLFRHGERMSDEQRRALLIEGQNLARVGHENVVTVHGADDHGGRVGIWMELIEGRTLSEIVNTEGAFGATEATLIGIELCRALAAVHRRGLVHGDLKAQNVKREAGGRFVLMDFSSSRRADGSPGNPDSDPMGTPLYMAPELWERMAPTVASDIYALGVLLYHLVTREFPVRASSIEALRLAHAAGGRHLLRDERPELPEPFVRIVEKALSSDPSERFKSAGALEEALSAQLEPVKGATATLPWEVRAMYRIARIGLWASIVFATLVAIGFVTSTALNVALGRPSAWAPQSVLDWGVWGARALIGPMYHVVVTLVPGLILWFAVRLVYRWAPVHRRLKGGIDRLSRAASAVGPTEIAVAGGIGIAALLWRYYDLIDAIYAVAAGSAAPSALALLSPQNEPYHLAYRRHFTLLVLGMIVAAVIIRSRSARERSTRSHVPRVAVVAVIACATVLMQFPWQILFQADFPRVRYAEDTCYEVGAKDEDLLLFCPLAPQSRTRIVPRDDESLVRTGDIESVFTVSRE